MGLIDAETQPGTTQKAGELALGMTRNQLERVRNGLLIQLRVIEELLWPEKERSGRKKAECKKHLARQSDLA